jgi:hypothetical protein
LIVGTCDKQAKLDGVNTADFRSVRITLIMLCSVLGRMESLHRVVAVLAKGESPTALPGDVYTCTHYRKTEAISSQILDHPPRVLKSPHIGSTKNIRERPDRAFQDVEMSALKSCPALPALCNRPTFAAKTAVADSRCDPDRLGRDYFFTNP